MHHSIAYRRDIDGLRAVAVLSVILYHFDVPGFGGGFAGVDVFFVISGFLIGGHIADGIAAGNFSLAEFYERRIRRIFPGLFALLALVLLAAPAILFRPDLARLARVACSVIPFLANFEIERALRSYSGSFVLSSPLAHTWSLAVEEQFYLLFPLAMLLVARWTRQRYGPVLLALALLSFLSCVVAARLAPVSNFYLAPFRAWELLLGALLATGRITPPRNDALRGGLAVLGLALILSSDLLLKSWTPFPSEYALPACGGAALILYAACDRRVLAGRVLDNPVAQRIGLWSYSLYLVHWPLLVFARYYAFDPLSPAARAMLLAATFVLGALSWRYVEQPFRGADRIFTRRGLFAAAATAAVALVLMTAAMRFAAPAWQGAAWATFPGYNALQERCANASPVNGHSCILGAPAAPIRAILWGDSHALAMLPAVDAAFARHGEAVAFAEQGNCAPLAGVTIRMAGAGAADGSARDLAGRRQSQACRRRTDAVLDWVVRNRITTVIVAGHWLIYSEGEHGIRLADAQSPDNDSPAGNTAIFKRGLERLLAVLGPRGVRVFVLEDPPQIPVDTPHALAAAARLGLHRDFRLSRVAYDRQQASANQVFAAMGRTRGLQILKPQDILCAGGTCAIQAGGQVLYIDDEHLSPAGAMLVRPALEPIWAGPPRN